MREERRKTVECFGGSLESLLGSIKRLLKREVPAGATGHIPVVTPRRPLWGRLHLNSVERRCEANHWLDARMRFCKAVWQSVR